MTAPLGTRGIFLSDEGYKNAKASEQRGEAKIRSHAAVCCGSLYPDNRSVKNRPEMIPKPYKRQRVCHTLSAIPLTFPTGLTGQIFPENDTGNIQILPLSRYTRPNRRKERFFMPRMSKKRRLEWAFFLNERNRITFNALCRGCTHDCKQSFRAIVVLCPRYYSKRWKARPADKENQDYVR